MTLTVNTLDAVTPLWTTIAQLPLDTDIAQVLQDIIAVTTTEVVIGYFVRCKVH